MMHTYSIMPLDTEHVDAICQDIARQYRENISTCPLFMMTIHPEGNPPMDKVHLRCAEYDLFKKKLDAMGVPSGILAQSTLGHGYTLNAPPSFTTYLGVMNGQPMGVACPADVRFREYMRDCMAVIASHHPKAIMIDDDCRLYNRPGKGCACPLHMAAFNRKAGTSMTREELAEYLNTHPADDPLTRLYLETQNESIHAFLVAAREGVDSVDPSIQGVNCLTSRNSEVVDCAWNVFSGRGNPVILRLPNGTYAPESTKHFSDILLRTSATMAAIRGKADVILAETDTIPFNRYAKSASYLHGHFTSALLDGCAGAKHWITRLHTYEPKSGEAFRQILAKHAGMYEAITGFAKEIRWAGACIPFASRLFDFRAENPWKTQDNDFAECSLERMGIPIYYSDAPQKTAFLNGDQADALPDAMLHEMFRGAVFLASDTAKKLLERGYAKEIGVDVQPYEGVPVTAELFPNGNTMTNQKNLQRLIPTESSVQPLSWAYHLQDEREQQRLFPATALYEKPDGSFTVTFCGTPKAAFNYMEGFSFLNETRKAQFVALLRKAGDLPAYYDGDAEVLMRAGWLADGKLLCAVWELGYDTLEEIPFGCDRPVIGAEALQPDGSWCEVPFRTEEDGCRIVLQTTLRPMMPGIFRLRF